MFVEISLEGFEVDVEAANGQVDVVVLLLAILQLVQPVAYSKRVQVIYIKLDYFLRVVLYAVGTIGLNQFLHVPIRITQLQLRRLSLVVHVLLLTLDVALDHHHPDCQHHIYLSHPLVFPVLFSEVLVGLEVVF